MALRLVPGYAADRIVAALAAEKAAIAVVAVLGMFHQSQDRPTRNDAEQSAERTECSAPKAAYTEVDCKNEDEDDAQPNALTKIGLLEIQQQGSEHKVQDASYQLNRGKSTVFQPSERGL